MTVSDKNPMIAAPLKLSDCSLISDGAAAVVLAHPSEFGRFRRVVGFRAAKMVSDYLPLSAKRLELFEGPALAIQRAYAEAGIRVDNLDLAEVHDCFTIAELQAVEALGLAAVGQGGAVVRERQTDRAGRLPINLSGGLKAKGRGKHTDQLGRCSDCQRSADGPCSWHPATHRQMGPATLRPQR